MFAFDARAVRLSTLQVLGLYVHIGVNCTVLHDTVQSPPIYSLIADLCIRVK